MYRNTKSGVERIKQVEYLKTLIKDAFQNVDRQKKGYVIRQEISSIMRYLGQFPSQAQVVDVILPQIQQDEPTNFVYYQKFQKFMLQSIIKNDFEPIDADTLLASFRVLDPQRRGYIQVDALKQILTTQQIKLYEQQWVQFQKFAVDPQTNVVNYQDYVSRLFIENDRHIQSLMKGYENFKYP